jgi:hypothetical protein
MTELRAFVGHSFEEADAEIVLTFLRFFEQLSKSPIPFSWQHAEAAEPRLLADKVLSLIADKNVFIGICTRREFVVAPREVVGTYVPRHHLRGEKAKFEWKHQIG